MALLCISVPRLVSCTFSTIPIILCPVLIFSFTCVKQGYFTIPMWHINIKTGILYYTNVAYNTHGHFLQFNFSPVYQQSHDLEAKSLLNT